MKGAFPIFCRYNFLMRESFWEIAEITAETYFFSFGRKLKIGKKLKESMNGLRK